VVAVFAHRGELDFWALAGALLVAVLELAGILYAWKCNGGSEGRAFLDRYLSINWVVSLRVGLSALAVFMVLVLTATVLGQQDMMDENPLYSILVIAMLAGLIAWKVGRHVGEVRAMADARLSSAPPVPQEQAIERLDKLVESIVKREISTVRRTSHRRPRKRKASRRK